MNKFLEIVGVGCLWYVLYCVHLKDFAEIPPR